ncbi:MAG: four helix bundle protein [Chloroflexi bacterium]|nr:four helix bundle protein [Chloroflexota bacterium]
MNYEEWLETVPEIITTDVLWKMQVYRLALFLSDLGWLDATKLMQDRRTHGLSDQLYRAVCSISANIAEGYSRGSGRDRARFYEYALGSARESRDWYFKSRYVLGNSVMEHRLNLLAQIIRLLLTIIPRQRQRVFKEEQVAYHADLDSYQGELSGLLSDVPLPPP